MVNLENDLLWRAAFSGRVPPGEDKPQVVLNLEGNRNHGLFVLKGAIQHVLADDLGPLLKKKGVKPGAQDPMWESVVAEASAAVQQVQPGTGRVDHDGYPV